MKGISLKKKDTLYHTGYHSTQSITPGDTAYNQHGYQFSITVIDSLKYKQVLN